ncbi:MAG: 30S ribosomal protein S6 [Oscillospiraceae bacterium]
MAKLNEKYEAVIILNTKAGEDSVKALKEKITALIEKNATMDSVDEWGKRRLAYTIKDETEGFYILYKFTSVPSFPAELDRVLKITDGILRSLITERIGE